MAVLDTAKRRSFAGQCGEPPPASPRGSDLQPRHPRGTLGRSTPTGSAPGALTRSCAAPSQPSARWPARQRPPPQEALPSGAQAGNASLQSPSPPHSVRHAACEHLSLHLPRADAGGTAGTRTPAAALATEGTGRGVQKHTPQALR